MPRAPVTEANRLFIAGLDGAIYALDAASGRVSWKRKLAAAPSTALTSRSTRSGLPPASNPRCHQTAEIEFSGFITCRFLSIS